MKTDYSPFFWASFIGAALLTIISCSNDDGCVTQTFYLDRDLDGFGGSESTSACKAPTASVGQYVTQGGDANDNDVNINPNCDLIFYLDADNDGFGIGDPLLFCENPDEDIYTDNDTAFDCDDSDPTLNPDILITYYPDADNDGYGDPNGQTRILPICEPTPEGFIDNKDDCDDTNANANPGIGQIKYYSDLDNDGYGEEEIYSLRDSCDDPPEKTSLVPGDCDDLDPNINPEAEEDPNDGIDSNCDGAAEALIWTGPDFQFSKLANADWVEGKDTGDELTDNVTLTRSTRGFITNIAWWKQVIGQVPTENEDLPWEYFGRQAELDPVANVGNEVPNGGPHGVRWAILEQGGQTESWNNFDMYGELGSPTNFYSLNNVVTICQLLKANQEIINIVDDFGIDNTSEIEAEDFTGRSFVALENILLGAWLVEENIYFTITFTELSSLNFGGGPMTYIRSTPNN
nr:putative metal-binding motif-containing protein [uncultured Allomuricauda sp.]